MEQASQKTLFDTAKHLIRTKGAVLVRYAISGVLAGVVNLGTTALLAHYTGLHYLTIVSIAFLFAVVASFGLQKFFTFRDHHLSPAPRQLAVFALVASVNLVINGFFVFLLVHVTGTDLLVLDQAIAALGIACYSFFLFRYGIFRHAPKNEG